MLKGRREKLMLKYPELADNKFWKEYIEAKYNLKPIVSYSEKLRRPRADDIPEKFKEKPEEKKIVVYEEEF